MQDVQCLPMHLRWKAALSLPCMHDSPCPRCLPPRLHPPRTSHLQPLAASPSTVSGVPPPPSPALPSHSQQIRFGLQTPQEIVKCGVFHVYERALYKVMGVAHWDVSTCTHPS